MRLVLILLITLTGLSVFATNAQSLHSIKLQHRSASSLIPLIAPLLNEQEAISGQNSLMLLKADHARYQELTEIIRQLDIPAKQLLIEVKLPSTLEYRNSQQQLNIVITSQGDSRIANGSRNTISTRSNNLIHKIRVLDGHQASIKDARLIPLLSRSLRFGQNPDNRGLALSYYEVASALIVNAQLHGNSATVKITSRQSSLDQESNSGVRSTSPSTTIVVPLDQWTSLGGITQKSEKYGHTSFNTCSTERGTLSGNEVQIRVSVLP